jgi:signal peptidase II
LKILFVSFAVIIIDQVTKFLIKGLNIPGLGLYLPGIPYRTSIDVIPGVFQITYIENPGMAFGLEIGGKLFLSLFTIFATFLILYFIFKNRKESFYLRFALAMIFGGAVGNLIDRTFYGSIYGYAPIFYGNVVDFLHVNTPDFTIFGKYFSSFPIFNVADMAVSIGFILILFGYNKIFKEAATPMIDPEVLATGGILSRSDADQVNISSEFNEDGIGNDVINDGNNEEESIKDNNSTPEDDKLSS